ncbi:MAG: DUF4145 domain-containing protein [Clostridium beijerinckii]
MKSTQINNSRDYDAFCYNNKIKVIDECPVCHSKMAISDVTLVYDEGRNNMVFVIQCANQECKEVFAAIYTNNEFNKYDLKGIFPYTVEFEIEDSIKNISPSFYKIYSQAAKAKEYELFEICGVGYRKALEFLIKDYCISKNKNDEEKIKEMQLSPVINMYIANQDIKNMANRATWLGNDETHYVRLWNDKDIDDLLALIDLTCAWITLELKTKQYIQEMPSGKKNK